MTLPCDKKILKFFSVVRILRVQCHEFSSPKETCKNWTFVNFGMEMRSTNICLMIAQLFFILATTEACPQEFSALQFNPPTVVEQWGVFELTLTANNSYKNPYQADLIYATFNGPTRTLTIPGFWDGGNTWKVRISSSEVGTWTYFTTSSDSGLVSSGSFTCVSSVLHGGIRPMEDFPYHFQYEDRAPFWWFGETCWAGFRSDSSENLNSDTFKAYIDVRASQGFNYIHINALAGSNEGGEAFIGDVGNQINPTFWQEVDERVRYMNHKGMTVGIVLAWKSNGDSVIDWTDFPDQESRKRYCKYVASRYGAHNVVWILSGEYDKVAWSNPNSMEEWAELANAIRSADPHNRMIAIHGTGLVEDFADESWMSFGDYMQFYTDLHNSIIKSRDHGEPVVNAEYAYFLRDQDGDGVVDKPNSATLEEFRYASWDILMAGGYFVTGFGTTYLGGKSDPGPFNVNDPRNNPAEEDLQHMKAFFTSIEWWKLNPADSLVTGTGIHYCLSELGRQYVVYVRGVRDSVILKFGSPATKIYSVRCFDPREGVWTSLSKHVSCTPLILQPPDDDDWIFYIQEVSFDAQFPTFTDVTAISGIITESVGTYGVFIADVDGDADPDIFVNGKRDIDIPSGYYKGNFLFRNNGDGRFTRIDSAAGVQDIASSAHGAIFFDMDHDGDYDLAIGHGLDGLPRRGLFRNDGSGMFTQVDSIAGFQNTGDIGTRAIVAGDMNGDGFMDICFSSWNGFDMEYYWGDGTGHFTRQFGLNDPARAIQGMTMADLDSDGDLDILMGNFDTNAGIGYYQNNGEGVFTRVTGLGLPDTGNRSETVNLGDIDSDGDLDVLICGYDDHYDLYRNNEGHFFKIQTFPATSYFDPGGIGVDNGAFGDFDNDGDLDLFLPAADFKLWLNDGSGFYYPIPDSLSGLLYEIRDARFPALLDYDGDGDLDIFLTQHDGPAMLFRNNIDNSNYLRIRLTGVKGDVGGFGTKVWLYDGGFAGHSDHLILYQEAMASAGYCIQHEPVLHFGVGNRSTVDVVVKFLDGSSITLENVTPGQVLNIEGGKASCDISGHVGYYSNQAAIRGVKLTVFQDSLKFVETDENGNFLLANLQGYKNYTLRPFKPPDSDVGEFTILTYDAALTAQAAVGLRQLTDYQTIAADVNKDGKIYTYDAALIARYAVGLPKLPSSHAGQWVFIPDSIRYEPLDSDKTNQNFVGILLGDVHGGWSPPGSSSRKGIKRYTQLKDTTAFSGKRIVIPLFIEENRGMISCDITFRYDPKVLKFVEVTKTELTQGFELLYDLDQGKLKVGLYGVNPINKAGEIVKLIFKVIGKPGKSTPLLLDRYQVNDGLVRQAVAVFRATGEREPPKNFSLEQNYPNPFNSETVIKYQVPKAGKIVIKIFDLLGREVKTLVDETKEAGYYQIVWDGKDKMDNDAPSGIYLCRAQFSGYVQIQKIIKLR